MLFMTLLLYLMGMNDSKIVMLVFRCCLVKSLKFCTVITSIKLCAFLPVWVTRAYFHGYRGKKRNTFSCFKLELMGWRLFWVIFIVHFLDMYGLFFFRSWPGLFSFAWPWNTYMIERFSTETSSHRSVNGWLFGQVNRLVLFELEYSEVLSYLSGYEVS